MDEFSGDTISKVRFIRQSVCPESYGKIACFGVFMLDLRFKLQKFHKMGEN